LARILVAGAAVVKGPDRISLEGSAEAIEGCVRKLPGRMSVEQNQINFSGAVNNSAGIQMFAKVTSEWYFGTSNILAV
jgi:hypothetical protein